MTEPLGDNARKQLQGYISEIERLEDEKAVISLDIKEIYNSASEAGFDKKAMRALVKRRAADKEKLAAFEATLEAYEAALGDLKGTPLGNAAIERAGVAPHAA